MFHHLARAPCTLYSDVLPCFELIEKRLSSQSGFFFFFFFFFFSLLLFFSFSLLLSFSHSPSLKKHKNKNKNKNKKLIKKTEALELLEEPDDNQNRPCHVAAKEGNKELMDYLMRKGVDLTVPNDKLFTCMVCIYIYIYVCVCVCVYI